MTFVQLYYFSKIVEHSSINAAAEECFVSYNAVYKALKSLEKELETTLVIRDANGIVLTPAGEKFYSDVCDILKISESWKRLKNPKTLNSVVKICSTPLFVNNKTLQKIADSLQEKGILLDYQTAFPDYMEAIFLQKKDYVIIFPNAPKYSLMQLANKCGYTIEYLCSDECNVFLNKKYIKKGQKEVTLKELNKLMPIAISNTYTQLTSFNAEILLKNSKEHYTCQNFEDAIELLDKNKAFILLRSLQKEQIMASHSETIGTLKLKDFQTGCDYYLAYKSMCNIATQEFVGYFVAYCHEHFSQEKFF